jgi:hypothetical protein
MEGEGQSGSVRGATGSDANWVGDAALLLESSAMDLESTDESMRTGGAAPSAWSAAERWWLWLEARGELNAGDGAGSWLGPSDPDGFERTDETMSKDGAPPRA